MVHLCKYTTSTDKVKGLLILAASDDNICWYDSKDMIIVKSLNRMKAHQRNNYFYVLSWRDNDPDWIRDIQEKSEDSRFVRISIELQVDLLSIKLQVDLMLYCRYGSNYFVKIYLMKT